jgi:hypothetical protein
MDIKLSAHKFESAPNTAGPDIPAFAKAAAGRHSCRLLRAAPRSADPFAALKRRPSQKGRGFHLQDLLCGAVHSRIHGFMTSNFLNLTADI